MHRKEFDMQYGVPAGVVERSSDAEKDPTGKSPHETGAKVDAGKPRFSLVLGSFARALKGVVEVGTFGAAKYTDDGWLSVPDGFRRYEDAQMRHQFYRHAGETHDSDSNLLHLKHEAWNALAKLELYLRAQAADPANIPSMR